MQIDKSRADGEWQAVARKLFARGVSIEAIASILSLPVKRIAQWAEQLDFKRWHHRHLPGLHGVRQLLLESLLLLREGKAPVINADEVLKYSNAYEKLFGGEKVVLYMQESFERLTTALVEEVDRAPTAYKKKKALEVLKKVREKMEELIEQVFGEVNHE